MSNSTALRNDAAAHVVLRSAHLLGYRFPEGFGGFSATIEYIGPDTRSVGAVAVRAPRDVQLDVGAPEGVEGWIRQELGSMAGHRWPAPYEAGDGRYTLTLDDQESSLGALVRFHDDPFDSSYRIREGRIAQVNRQMGPVRFSINIQQHTPTADGRLLPAHFTVAYWDVAQGRLTRADTYSDQFAVVDGTHLPAYRRVITADDNGVTRRELLLSAHDLLPPSDIRTEADAARVATRTG